MDKKKIRKKSISIICPVYNEQEIVEETVENFINGLSCLFDKYELIIVDDASTDMTWALLQNLPDKYKGKLTLIRNPANQGSGRSLFTGMQHAKFEFVATNFADRPFDIKELKNIMLLFDERTDFVAVCRYNRSANTTYRKITSVVNCFLIRALFKVGIDDFQFVQVYRREMLYNIKVNANGTFVPPELMIRAIRSGSKWKQYKAHFYARSRGKAKCGHPRVILRTLFDMISFWLELHFGLKRTRLKEQGVKDKL